MWFALAALALCGWGVQSWEGGARHKIAASGQWHKVEAQPIAVRIGLAGRIEPAAVSTITAPFEGNLRLMHVVEGQRVVSGQMLLEMDTADIDIRLRQTTADLLKAKSVVQVLVDWDQGVEASRARRVLATARMNLSETARKLADTRALFARGIVARMEIDSLEQQAKIQQLEAAAAEAELRSTLARGVGESRQIADMDLANAQARHDALTSLRAQSTMIAPFPGVVMAPPALTQQAATAPQPGARLSQGQALLRVASVERLRAAAKVDEIDINQLREGMDVRITGDGFAGVALDGRIVSLGAQLAEPEGRGNPVSYEVMVDIVAPEESGRRAVRLGMSGQLEVVIYRNDRAIVVPSAAIRSVGDRRVVRFRRGPGDKDELVVVTIGRAMTQGVEVFGLSEGEVALAEDPIS
ncbi:efflux RND transporter periplasmic adaptor subunit [Achromobacter xylosoxidans]|uniref:efflux RND transporter periplasmic adaptor subunit n=1 Tax=Alcaligenes xylosoxydans xylosoxydans TaxID=85698 RepID=UPI0015C5B0F5|nr:HlyD family efflux transporter periplasmic adaptor subunit [Achromobacter xylosoxidans]